MRVKVDINLYLAYRGLVELDLQHLINQLDEMKIKEYLYQNYKKEISDDIFINIQIDVLKVFQHHQEFIQELIRRKLKKGLGYIE